MRKNILKQEFIGFRATVVDATDPTLCGVQGHILDETKNMLVIETDRGIKKVAKKNITFTINGEHIEGNRIAYRPEERIRKIP